MEDDLPATIWDVPTPSLLVDIDKVKRNSQNMIEKCKKLGLTLRPHMKTQKTVEGGELMTGGSKRCIVVSTLAEAEFFADHGFDDILYGVVFIEDKLRRCQKLSERLEEFHLMLDSRASLECLEKNPLKDKKWSVFIKVDCRTGRCGLPWDSPTTVEFAETLSKSNAVHLKGLYAHCGNTYESTSVDEVHQRGNECAQMIATLRNSLKSRGIEFDTFGIGSTPTALEMGDKVAQLVNELHPGNYVFCDMMQVLLGTATIDDIACRLATRVIGHYPESNRLCVNCGFTALTKQGEGTMPAGYVKIVGDPNLRLDDMTQEVGIMYPQQGELDYSKHPINSLLFFYPYHSCATACCHDYYYIHSGEKIVGKWKTVRGW